MSTMRSPLAASLLAVALLGTGVESAYAATAPAGQAETAATSVSLARAAVARVASFDSRSIRTVRGSNQVTVDWPARSGATGYTLAWAPTNAQLPASPDDCVSPCRKRATSGTVMTLSAADMSTPGRRVSSASGNVVRLKVYAHNSAYTRPSPYGAFTGSTSTAAIDWLPTANAQLPAPMPAAAGRSVAVSSFNVLSATSTSAPAWATRAPQVVAQINALGSSIVATQEASNSASKVASGKSQFADLAARLAPSGWRLADDRNWDKALGLSRYRSTQANRIFYKASAWEQVDRGALRTHVPIAGATEGTNVDRWVSWTRLRATADRRTQVCVLDAHLITNLGSYDKASADHRNEEVRQILSELRSSSSTVRRVGTRVGQACAGVPTVLAGDLNAAAGHAPYGNMPQESFIDAGFVDTKNAQRRVGTHWTGTGRVGTAHAAYGTQIDYVLTRGTGGATSFTVNAVTPGRDGSDHFPVTAVVNVPPTS